VNVYGSPASSTQPAASTGESQPTEGGTAPAPSAAVEPQANSTQPDAPPTEAVSDSLVIEEGTSDLTATTAGFEGLIEAIPLADPADSVASEPTATSTTAQDVEVTTEIPATDVATSGPELSVPAPNAVAEAETDGVAGPPVAPPVAADTQRIEAVESGATASLETSSTTSTTTTSAGESGSADAWATVVEFVPPQSDEAAAVPAENLVTRKGVEPAQPIEQPLLVQPVVSRTPEPQLPVTIPLFSARTEQIEAEQPAQPVADAVVSVPVTSTAGAVTSTPTRPAAAPTGLVEGLVHGFWGAAERRPSKTTTTDSLVAAPQPFPAESLDAWSGLAAVFPAGPETAVEEPTAPMVDRSSSTTGGLPQASTKPSNLGAIAAAEPGSVAEPRVDQRDIISRQVLPALATAKGEGRAVVLRLDPPELGALRVQVTVRERSVVAVLEAERPETRQLLGDSLPQLREALQQQGFGIDRIEVSLADGRFDDQHSAGAGGFGGRQSGGREQGEPGAALPAENPTSPTQRRGSTVPKPHMTPSRSGIDVQV
jgi:flagellar hook-length control protein FliK